MYCLSSDTNSDYRDCTISCVLCLVFKASTTCQATNTGFHSTATKHVCYGKNMVSLLIRTC
jgi:hypothetical protein